MCYFQAKLCNFYIFFDNTPADRSVLKPKAPNMFESKHFPSYTKCIRDNTALPKIVFSKYNFTILQHTISTSLPQAIGLRIARLSLPLPHAWSLVLNSKHLKQFNFQVSCQVRSIFQLSAAKFKVPNGQIQVHYNQKV